MRQLSSLDAQFLALEDARTYGHVSGLAIYDPASAPGGTVTIEDVRRLVAERIHLITPFRRRVVEVPFALDYPYWIEDPDFDLDFHVRELALPAPGDDEQLGEQIGRIVARPLDRSRPLWELYAIQGLARGRMAILTKVHHSAVDGLSGAEIMSILLDPTPEGRPIAPAPPRELDAVPGQLEMLARGVLAVPTQPKEVHQSSMNARAAACPSKTPMPTGDMSYTASGA
jgi:diacylglycerol O-acyltransferase / wax synthase